MSARHRSRRLAATAMLVAACSIAWLDPHATLREANRLYDQGEYEEAATKYNQALVDEPGSTALHFNLGAAAYKQGKYGDAVNDFEKAMPGGDDPVRTARVAYNLGNAKYRQAEAAETADPKAALGLYAEALAAYRRTMGAAPDDEDAKFNHELAAKRLHDLEKKLEEQQQEQQQQEQQPQGEEEQDQQQEQDQQTEEQQEQQEPQAKEQTGEREQQQPQPSAEQQEGERPKEAEQQARPESEKPEPAEQPQGEAGSPSAASEQAGAGEELNRQEATALLDAQRDQEVQPEEIIRRLHGAVAEPAQDW